ncbi:MAG: methyltransferase domain-containing protein [Candidatus Marinimicrobia bacterium]|nr:methyltransferase domain-containing protein [Candidatus Neomarinimicrobiota bacterium]
MFDKKTALKELKRYRKKGPHKTTRMLLKAIQKKGIKGLDFLDIGGGIGAIQNDLIKEGAANGTNIEASKAYVEIAKEEALDNGIAEKVKFRQGDFTTIASDSDSADIVTLDKVICCYDDMSALVGLSSRLARKIYGVIYPRDVWWVKIALPILNLYPRIRGSSFRAFIHPTKKVEEIILGNGLKHYYYATTFVWQVAVFTRDG